MRGTLTWTHRVLRNTPLSEGTPGEMLLVKSSFSTCGGSLGAVDSLTWKGRCQVAVPLFP